MAFIVRQMRPQEASFAIACAAAEGWNPGDHDAVSFYHADPDGFFVGELDGELIGCIAAVSYGDFGFIGLYIVVPAQRGRGYGMALWQAAMQRLAAHNIGLDGVREQQANYAQSGFVFAYGNIRYEGHATTAPPSPPNIVAAAAVSFADLCEYDKKFFPAPRRQFLRDWIAQPHGRAVVWRQDNGNICGLGVSRPCRQGYKIGPLFADDKKTAAALIKDLVAALPAGTPFYLDAPSPNKEALALAADFAMQPVFETARMYTKFAPPLNAGVFGVTTFELG